MSSILRWMALWTTSRIQAGQSAGAPRRDAMLDLTAFSLPNAIKRKYPGIRDIEAMWIRTEIRYREAGGTEEIKAENLGAIRRAGGRTDLIARM